MTDNYLSTNNINDANKEDESITGIPLIFNDKHANEKENVFDNKITSGTSTITPSSPNDATPIKSNSKKIEFNQLDDDESKEELADTIQENNQQQIGVGDGVVKSNGPHFIRNTRKCSVTQSTIIHGKLDIIGKLNYNRNIISSQTQSTTIIEDESPISKLIPYEDSPTRFEPLRKPIKKKSLFNKNSFNIKSENIYDQPKYCVDKGFSVLEFSYQEDQNVSQKKYMEDKGKAIDCYNSNPDQGLFCLFDGHGGLSVASYLQNNYPPVFKKALLESNGNIEQALKASFKEIDLDIKSLELVNVGSTGCVIYITKEDDKQIVYTANVGDTRCSLISPNNIQQLSYDHKANDPKEKKRVINSGGWVLNDRVMGRLMVSRAFGDFELKSFGVKAAPTVNKRVINLNEKNQYLIMASDGVWDIIEEKEMQNYIMFADTASLSKMIIKNSLAKGSWDNVSCFAIKLT